MAGDQSVSPGPTVPSAFFGLTQTKAWYLYSEVFDLKSTSRLSKDGLKNPAHMSNFLTQQTASAV
jgi:hypothetical protein